MFVLKSSRPVVSLIALALFGLSGCSGLSLRDSCWGGSCAPESCGVDGCGHSSKKWYHFGKDKHSCDDGSCTADQGCDQGCDPGCKDKKFGKCKDCGTGCSLTNGCCGSCLQHRSLAIPDEYPVGAVMRSHFHQMQTNGEAVDFILFQKDFVLESAELTPDGKDKILEIAARMRSAPFPVIVERTWNNADPEMDAHRRAIVAQILADLGNPDANVRTFVSPAYGPGKNSMEAVPEFYQYMFSGSGNNNSFNNGGFGGGAGGGFGGGGAGGGSF